MALYELFDHGHLLHFQTPPLLQMRLFDLHILGCSGNDEDRLYFMFNFYLLFNFQTDLGVPSHNSDT